MLVVDPSSPFRGAAGIVIGLAGDDALVVRLDDEHEPRRSRSASPLSTSTRRAPRTSGGRHGARAHDLRDRRDLGAVEIKTFIRGLLRSHEPRPSRGRARGVPRDRLRACKGLVATEIVRRGPRRRQPFVMVPRPARSSRGTRLGDPRRARRRRIDASLHARSRRRRGRASPLPYGGGEASKVSKPSMRRVCVSRARRRNGAAKPAKTASSAERLRRARHATDATTAAVSADAR